VDLSVGSGAASPALTTLSAPRSTKPSRWCSVTAPPHLEQQVLDLKLQLEERDEDLAVARATSKELMTQLNHPGQPQ
jgi:hypothetical protein